MVDKFPQQDMFAHQYAGTTPRVAGSDTSALAGDSVLGSARSKRRAVYDHICATGGATDDEVEVALDMRHQTASARRRELVLSGAVHDSGERRNTRSGCAATVWVEM